MSGPLAIARQSIDEIIAIRHDIHAHPELGFEETRTAALIAGKLRKWGVEVTEGIAGTGVVGTIRGRRAGTRSIGLRADMDALAVCEANTFAHASTRHGVMHACGHDGHSAMLLGAAQVLAANPDFAGTVNLIFQPAEEGRGGALAMIESGLFERFPCDRIFGMHTYPGLPVGTFGIRKHEMMAASGRFEVRFTGSGGHGGASPHTSVDLGIVAAHFLFGLQTLVARNVPPLELAIISVGNITAGDPNALNVIPPELRIGGTMRAFTRGVQRLLETRIAELAESFAQSEGAKAATKCWWLSEPLINDPDATDNVIAAAVDLVGAKSVNGDLPRVTAGEDFASMLRMRPGAYILLGNGRHGGDGGGNVHTPHYDFNDEALPFGIGYWLSVVNVELDGRLGTV
ncbi:MULTISPECIES: amidohydrolase [unclassified Burkholderia]|uniref:amidohydrolase n=1 Tax=unclassified Burkholderia TaxID=2613784 RepID=UPI000F583C9D|nr:MULTISPECIES: amidohydrolase [unclassified Burkholderia]RQR68760.1 amidohydrolase [Burkholderia sp. Bp9012]RQR70268.1 amidohydrolase [Burkholderia sp. Bp9011]RQR83014.1 amidohydrolase [Burkholderia sp. Bp9010]RQZ39423.1 amidohydrolase [Burkholderia sp. Bp9099]